MRITFAEINLSNLNKNYLSIKKQVNNLPVMAVVKADAYGHGMIKCVQSLEKLGDKKPEFYGVALNEEAYELGVSNLTRAGILSFAPFEQMDFNLYKKYNISATICSLHHLKQVKNLPQRGQLKVHVNVDTGMGRLGIPFDEAVNFIQKLYKLKNVFVEGVYTHFATSDELKKSFANLQLKRFNKVIDGLKNEGIEIPFIHAANSGAILDLPESYFNMVRPGISLYGYYPSTNTTESIKLQPVMNLVSQVETVKNIKKGDSVSYGRKFIAKKDTNIVSLPIGYADGIPRGLTNKMKAIIKNKEYPQIGTITMDRIMFDIGNDKIQIASKVILLGKSKDSKISADDWSAILGTIPYEITCGISKRVPRVYR